MGKIRKANIEDVSEIQKLINRYAKEDLMLPRSLNELYETTRDFFVYVEKGKIFGCAALHIAWENLAEIRSLAIAPTRKNKGAGRRLLVACMEEARKLKIKKIFALTYETEYFKKFGFKRIPKSKLPHKIWSECIKCFHFPNCKEVALMKEI